MSDRISGSGPRYHALDSLRAAAMLLGVLYHALIFRFIFSGKQVMMNPGFPRRWTLEWMHSFRMPLFFLISGFFGAMMFEKYGAKLFVRRRWSRIGIPMLFGLLTLSPLSAISFMFVVDMTASSKKDAKLAEALAKPDASPAKAKDAPAITSKDATPEKEPKAAAEAKALAASEVDLKAKGQEPASSKAASKPPGGGDDSPFDMPPPPPTIARRLIGDAAGLFSLGHFWFLWYLLVFVTVMPLVVMGLERLSPRISPERFEQSGLLLIRRGLMPMVLGVVSIPALYLAPAPFGWSLGTPVAGGLPFPDFAIRYDPELGFYFLYFAAGWCLYVMREGLPNLAKAWIPNLIIGTVAFTIATQASSTYFTKPTTPHYGWIKVGTYVAYCLGQAFTALGFLGLFERYCNRPSRTGRYLADTAFWVYVIHLPLVSISLGLFKPLHLHWVLDGLCTAGLSTAVALLLYQYVVRHTFLMRLYGPAVIHKPKYEPSLAELPMPEHAVGH
ncbi:acyltransferase family protein [Singulisphaera sp. PoT]|uniref:acyltransferase family protein n=1 Tax=Singulisphaera sp. PoT TaxID=3411797 RepID=UPI003BF51183